MVELWFDWVFDLARRTLALNFLKARAVEAGAQVIWHEERIRAAAAEDGIQPRLGVVHLEGIVAGAGGNQTVGRRVDDLGTVVPALKTN